MLSNIKNAKRQLKTKFPRTPYTMSLFNFKAMASPKSSLNYPFTYAANYIKFALALEWKNGTDLHDVKSIRKLPLQGFVDKLKTNPITFTFDNTNNSKMTLGDIIPPVKAKHILVATTWRSGSTFLGDLLSRYPGVFYSFEPLHYVDHKSNLPADTNEPDSLKLVSDVFKCKPESGYFIHSNKPENRFLFRHNFRLWNVCESLLMAGSACFMPELYHKTCPLFPIRVVKTVRLRVKAAEKLLNDPELGQTLKIVILVRDPRGVMNSRATMDWCKWPQCNDPRTVCQNLEEDVLAAYEIKKKFPGNIFVM